MKKCLMFCFAVLFFAVFPCVASADVVADDWKSYAGLPKMLGEDISDELPPGLFSDDVDLAADKLEELVGFESIIARVMIAAKNACDSHVKDFVTLLSMLIVCAMAQAASKSFPQFSSAFEICSCIVFSLSLYGMVSSCISVTEAYLGELRILVNSFIPVMGGMYFAGGNASAAVASSSSMMIFLNILENFCCIILMPALKVIFGFAMVSALSPVSDMSGITKLIKNTFTKLLTFAMLILSAVMTYQNSLASSADSLTARTVKFAVGNMVPVVGSAVGDSVRTVGASLSLIKNCAGVLGVVLLILICLPPLLWCVICRFELSVCSAAATLLGCRREGALIDEFSGAIGFSLAVACCCTLFFLYSLTLFIGSSLAMGA
jgi:stage III sporulation protein AE